MQLAQKKMGNWINPIAAGDKYDKSNSMGFPLMRNTNCLHWVTYQSEVGGSAHLQSTCTSYSSEKPNQCDWQWLQNALTMLPRWGKAYFRHFYAGKILCRKAIISAKHVFIGLLYATSLNPLAGVFCLQEKGFQHGILSGVCCTPW